MLNEIEMAPTTMRKIVPGPELTLTSLKNIILMRTEYGRDQHDDLIEDVPDNMK